MSDLSVLTWLGDGRPPVEPCPSETVVDPCELTAFPRFVSDSFLMLRHLPKNQ